MVEVKKAVAVFGAKLSYGKFRVLNDVSFAADKGQFVTLLGPSGCGKTTLLKVIAGFISLDSGEIEIDGRSMRGVPPEKRDTAMCFQSYALFPHLTVLDNIGFGLRQSHIGSKERSSRVETIAGQVGLSSHLAKLPGQLSGGQQQRVALARAMAVRPGVMLFDEPLSNLDAKLRDQVRLEIRSLQQQHGFTAIYVTHDQSEALAMSDLVIVMRAGVIEQMGRPEDIYHQPINRFVADFIGTANIMPVTVLRRDLVRNEYLVNSPLGQVLISSAKPPVSDHVYVCWRPEDASPANSHSSPVNRFKLRASTRTFLGSHCEITVAPSGQNTPNFRIQTHGSTKPNADDTIDVAIAPDAIRFLEQVTP